MLEAEGTGLRPLGVTGILDAAIEHVRDDPRLYYAITLPVTGPFAVVTLYLADMISSDRGSAKTFELRILIASALFALLLHLRGVAQGAATFALARRLEGREATALGAWRSAARRSIELAFATAAFWWMNVACIFAAILPVLASVPLLLLQIPVQVIEGRRPLSAMARSSALGRLEIGRAWTVTLILAGAFVAVAVGFGLTIWGLLQLTRVVAVVDVSWIEAVLSPKNGTFVLALLLFAHAVLEPVKAIAHALLYVDRRVRTEGFDLRGKVALVLGREREMAETSA